MAGQSGQKSITLHRENLASSRNKVQEEKRKTKIEENLEIWKDLKGASSTTTRGSILLAVRLGAARRSRPGRARERRWDARQPGIQVLVPGRSPRFSWACERGRVRHPDAALGGDSPGQPRFQCNPETGHSFLLEEVLSQEVFIRGFD